MGSMPETAKKFRRGMSQIQDRPVIPGVIRRSQSNESALSFGRRSASGLSLGTALAQEDRHASNGQALETIASESMAKEVEETEVKAEAKAEAVPRVEILAPVVSGSNNPAPIGPKLV